MLKFSSRLALYLGTVTLATTSALVTAFLSRDNQNLKVLFEEKKNLRNTFDLKELETTEQILKGKLDALNQKYLIALSTLSDLKTGKLRSIYQSFLLIDESEEELKRKYDELQLKIDELTELADEHTEFSLRKIATDQTIAFLRVYESVFLSLNRQLYEWDSTLQEIMCIVEKRSNCEQFSKLVPIQNILKSIDSTVQLGLYFDQPPEEFKHKSVERETTILDSSTDLEEIKSSLKSMSQELQKTWKESLENKAKLAELKTAYLSFSAYIDAALAWLDLKKVMLMGDIDSKTKAAEKLVENINQLTSFIQEAYKSIEFLREHSSTLRHYSNQIAERLCDLKTVENACPLKPK
ncbi:hypothetical protein MHLP_03235 [Candidatus Mycoplasma haematolamae str. Purdue]|uniref:Uncharacterized protein n=1 Tax=Mycoplasma haematolamae (strain Purdue) TaxID=1212765 RepID=I7C6R9_MYCHA|nr:hypothetical protein [Candidatus Mycoplasma haematolamae]AFO52227.1 hypothetical protein MHLP_03235 [Candidatus Mycoplasma haematolamae str. Purdue]